MARGPLPPGFRFHPTDVELVLYYLKRKVLGKPLRIQAITELDLYKYSPWDLPEKSCLRSKDLEWYFFCQKDRKYANGRRTNRATEVGYWKTTGRDRPICNDSQTVGMKKTLIFHLGRAPSGNRTNWVMHEYRLEIKELEDAGVLQDSYVLCKVFEKSGAGPKNGEQHGAPYVEEEWEDDLIEGSLAPLALVDTGSASVIIDEEKISATEDNAFLLGKTCESSPKPLYQSAPPPPLCRSPPPQPLCRSPPPQPLFRNPSPPSLQPICQNASSDASGETISEDVDMDTKVETSSEEDDRCQSGKSLDEETCVSALLSLKEKKAKTSLSEVVHRFEQGRRQLQLLLSN